MQMLQKELYKTLGVFALIRYYLHIDIDSYEGQKYLSSHPEKSDKN